MPSSILKPPETNSSGVRQKIAGHLLIHSLVSMGTRCTLTLFVDYQLVLSRGLTPTAGRKDPHRQRALVAGRSPPSLIFKDKLMGQAARRHHSKLDARRHSICDASSQNIVTHWKALSRQYNSATTLLARTLNVSVPV